MVYDTLNRLRQRSAPAVSYPQQVRFGTTFPRGSTLTLAADVAVFAYDIAGNMTSAWNGDARVTRKFRTSGDLEWEEQKVREYNTQNFETHIYKLSYSHDLEGRRTSLMHPGTLTSTQWADSVTRYDYENELGTLTRITNPLGRQFTFGFDSKGRLRRTAYPNSVVETRSYDADDQLATLKQVTAATDPVTGGFPGGRINDATLYRDKGGRIVRAYNMSERFDTYYSGLGSVIWSYYARCSACDEGLYTQRSDERFYPDALGNSLEDVSVYNSGEWRSVQNDYDGFGRLWRQREQVNGTWHNLPYEYDAAGNQTGHSRLDRESICSSSDLYFCQFSAETYYTDAKAMFYDAQNKLRVVDRRSSAQSQVFAPKWASAGGYEEYRYDALGRRVLRRWQSDPLLNGEQLDGHIERYVHDGDQILYEIRGPGSRRVHPYPLAGAPNADSLRLAEMDRLEAASPLVGWDYYGRVMYTHGLGIDQVLSATRVRVAVMPMLEIFPQVNWRGQYTIGTSIQGTSQWCNPSGQCASVNFRALQTRTKYDNGAQFQFDEPPGVYVGSLLQTKRDGSGQIYMRNRYYDPTTGRFTQEDPIGLAGGLNVYGFAGGDPVNYSDPFGLCPTCGDEAVDYYAGVATSSSSAAARGAANVGLAIASLWTTDTWKETAMTLASVAPVGRLVGTFKHFGYADDAAKFANGLREGSFATNRATSIKSGAEAVEKLALPGRATPPNATYRVTPEWWKYVKGPTRVTPANGQPGGGWEYLFPKGTGPGTVSGPRSIP